MNVLTGTRTPGGWLFLPISYRHDPDKDDAWCAREKAKYPDENVFKREYEIDFAMHVGSPAYPEFSDGKHVVDELEYIETMPLMLTFDFNTNPMSLLVCQMRDGWLLVLDEFVYGPATIDEIVTDFRNRYPAHRAELYVYGDSTRGSSTPQTAKSNWYVVQSALRGYTSKPLFKVPLQNPNIGDRLLAVNRKLKGVDGEPSLRISRRCRELIQDLREVVMSDDQKRIKKSYDPESPYSRRTHASDAIGYLIYREWPVVREILRLKSKRQPLRKDQLLGVEYGHHSHRPPLVRDTGRHR